MPIFPLSITMRLNKTFAAIVLYAQHLLVVDSVNNNIVHDTFLIQSLGLQQTIEYLKKNNVRIRYTRLYSESELDNHL